MKYTESVTLRLPRSRVIELFDDPSRLPSWQPDLIEMEPLEGIPGQLGSKMRLVYRMGQREIRMTQTVTRRNLPHEFSEQYESSGVWNQIDNRFSDLNGEQTRWQMDCEFRLQGWLRWMGWLMPGLFRRQTRKTMQRFKHYAEAEG